MPYDANQREISLFQDLVLLNAILHGLTKKFKHQ